MKKHFPLFVVLAALLLAVVFMSGCSTPDLSKKAVLIEGYSAVNLLDTGYNPVTGAFTPSINSIFSNGVYLGVPSESDNKDFLYYSDKSSSSMWNASAQTTQTILVFASTDKELVKSAVDSLKKAIDKKIEAEKNNTTENQKEADAAEAVKD